MSLTGNSPPAGWRMISGTWGTDATLEQTGATQFLSNDKFLRLTGSSEVEVESNPIPIRDFQLSASEICRTFWGIALQVSDKTAGYRVTVGIRPFQQDGTQLSTGYFLANDSGLTQLDGTNDTPSTSPFFAGRAFNALFTSGSVAYVKLFVKKSAHSFNCDIHGIVPRTSNAYCYGTEAASPTSVPDNVGTWTPIEFNRSTTVRMVGASGDGTASQAVAITGRFHARAVVQTSSLNDGDVLGIRIQSYLASGAASAIRYGQRIVAPGTSAQYIMADGYFEMLPGMYWQVEVQYVNNSGSTAANVDLVEFEAHDTLPWA